MNGHGFDLIMHGFEVEVFYHTDDGHKLIGITHVAGLNKPGILKNLKVKGIGKIDSARLNPFVQVVQEASKF